MMLTRLLARVAVLAFAILVGASCAAAQTTPVASRRPISAVQDPTAGVSGTILDSMNQAVSGAKIKVISDEQGFERRAETNDEGYFYVPFLPPGTYTVL